MYLHIDRKHVYEDLEPYVCLATNCTLGLHTFKSRKEWMEHEFQNHRVIPQWPCNLCTETFDAEDLFQSHLNDLHFRDVASSQIEEVIAASKRLIPRDAATERCPFCLTIPAKTQRAFASHVGKHQQEISLAALPNLDGSDEGGSSDDNDDDDGDHSDSDGDREEELSDRSDSDEKSFTTDSSARTVTSLTGKAYPMKTKTTSLAEENGSDLEGQKDQIKAVSNE